MNTHVRSGQVMMPAFYREASIVSASVDKQARTFDILWTAGAEVPRMDWWTGQRYVEVLEVTEKAIRLDRLQSGRAPVLDSHNRWTLENVIGVVEKDSVRIKDGKGHATVRLSARESVAQLLSDVADGIIANVSPGYITHSYREEMRKDVIYRIATDWEPSEISFVPVGADPEAGRRNAPQDQFYPCTVQRGGPNSPHVALARMRMRQRALG